MINAAGGHYAAKVKDNQPTLRAAIERLFAAERTWPGMSALKTDFQTVTHTTKGHGRCTTHPLTTSTLLNSTINWPGVAQVFQLTRTVFFPATGKRTHEVVYGLTSLPPALAAPPRLLDLSRRHWTIENNLHYCRDVLFHEDACSLAAGHAAQVIAIVLPPKYPPGRVREMGGWSGVACAGHP